MSEQAEMVTLYERLSNILRVEEPATIPQIKRWLLDEFSIREIDRTLEEMRDARAVTMTLIEDERGKLKVIYWYGYHE